MIDKLENSDYYARRIKFTWVEKLLKGKVKEEDMHDFMLDLIFKVICDKDGNDVSKDDVTLDDFISAQSYITSKINPEKKS